MPEEQFKRLALWQTKAATISDDFLRYCDALQLFGDDNNFQVCWPGDVHFIDRANPLIIREIGDGVRIMIGL